MLTRKSVHLTNQLPTTNISNRERIIFHVDMDAFFASVEQSANPNYRGKPVLVGGHSMTRGVVCAASYEARPYGVGSGMSLVQARKLCPHAIVVPANSQKYVETSQIIFQKLSEFTPQVEIFSIDEAFMDVTDTYKFFFPCVEDLGNSLRSWVQKRFGITMSVGIAPNKLLAKLVSDHCKPNGLLRIDSPKVEGFLKDRPINALCGIGPNMTDKLHLLGVRTCGQLAQFPEDILFERFGIIGPVLKRMGMGVDHSPVALADAKDRVKSVGHSYTLLEDTYDYREFRKYLLWLSERVGRRLRKQNLQGRTIHLKIRFSDKKSLGKQKKCHYAMDDGQDIYKESLEIFMGFSKKTKEHSFIKRGIRLIGVSVSDLSCKGEDLWFLKESEKQLRLRKAMDLINDQFGEFTVKLALLDFDKDKKIRSDVINLFGSGR